MTSDIEKGRNTRGTGQHMLRELLMNHFLGRLRSRFTSRGPGISRRDRRLLEHSPSTLPCHGQPSRTEVGSTDFADSAGDRVASRPRGAHLAEARPLEPPLEPRRLGLGGAAVAGSRAHRRAPERWVSQHVLGSQRRISSHQGRFRCGIWGPPVPRDNLLEVPRMRKERVTHVLC